MSQASNATIPTGSTPPTAPAAPNIASFSNDTGVAGDGITNDNTLTLAGTAAANSTVKVFDGTTQIGTATANSRGAWTYTTAALSDGNHSLKATATTASGTSAASSALAVRIDTTAPTPPAMATLSGNANGGAIYSTQAPQESNITFGTGDPFTYGGTGNRATAYAANAGTEE